MASTPPDRAPDDLWRSGPVYTASDLEQTENQIWNRFRHAGRFEIVSISLRPQGVLEVGVVGDLADARAALADYQDQVRVVRGAIGTPA